MLSAIHDESNRRARGTPDATPLRSQAGSPWSVCTLSAGPRGCHGENSAGALEKLPAGNITFAFAHKTFQGKLRRFSLRICIIYPTTRMEGITIPFHDFSLIKRMRTATHFDIAHCATLRHKAREFPK